MKSLEVERFERYLNFHLAEIIEELKSNDEDDSVSNPGSIWNARSGSSANFLTEHLLRTREDITSALARIQEGTYGNCVRCGKEVDLRELHVVPWSKFCIVCRADLERRQMENRLLDSYRFSTAQG